MKVAVVTMAFGENRPVEHLARALNKRHEVEIVGQLLLEKSFREKAHDLYVCVDGNYDPLDFHTCYLIDPLRFKKMSFWFTNWKQNSKYSVPSVTMLSALGGWIFQSQLEDVKWCWGKGIRRCSWLPMAVDPIIWPSFPDDGIAFDVAFIGNVYDRVRAGVLQQIHDSGLTFGWNTSGVLDKREAAYMIGHSRLGFNIASYSSDRRLATEVNSRVFEVLSCGVPLVTNDSPDLKPLNLSRESFVRTFKKESEVLPTIKKALQDKAFLQSGGAAREWVSRNATYDLRVDQLLAALTTAGVLN